MQRNTFHLSNLVPFLPYLYFIGLSLWMFLSQMDNNANVSHLKLLILAVPFTVQLIFSFKYVDLVLGILTFALALYLTLAYASDVAKITDYTARAISFIAVCGLMVILNFVMSILLFRNERLRIRQTAASF
ncbi:hypothetical protein HB364_27910 [Pseudoflavitalea sp. X16]|uniref:hypothetical protein n=1 Tax=Paraflavitalea devenefica TaxID=2716334 RepID=UPI00141FB095|nr:hypothetical protein [Paraflavitalea devenefica]NII28936.1 hypothetical protein [Paraflavitalea devenefica]